MAVEYREAVEYRGNLVVFRFDLTKAYSSVCHMLVEEVLERYHVHQKLKDLVQQVLTECLSWPAGF